VANDLEPSVAELLDVDREYRKKVHAGALPLIAPSRNNPTGAVWLPILHTRRGERQRPYTVMFSNTARAHRAGKTDDWVVLYWHDGLRQHQCTVITAEWGPLQGERTVMGRSQSASPDTAAA
jgi:hypothetical protein